MYRCVQLLAVALAVLATGCCLPRLGGRYEGAECSQCDEPAGDAKAESPGLTRHEQPEARWHDRGHALGHRHGHLRAWYRSRRDGPGTPPGQVVPLPRFHPVPVRPVFEPQFDYTLPDLLQPLAPLEVAAPLQGEPTPAAPSAALPAESA